MKRVITIALLVSMIMVSTACSKDGGQDGGIKKSDFGALAGAVGGAVVGSKVGKGTGNVAGIAAGTLLGAYIGNQVGASLDRADMAYYDKTSQYALEETKTGQVSKWSNPDSGNYGTITPTRTYQTADNSYCREYTQTINVGGKEVDSYGTACRQPDGSWKIKE